MCPVHGFFLADDVADSSKHIPRHQRIGPLIQLLGRWEIPTIPAQSVFHCFSFQRSNS